MLLVPFVQELRICVCMASQAKRQFEKGKSNETACAEESCNKAVCSPPPPPPPCRAPYCPGTLLASEAQPPNQGSSQESQEGQAH